MKTKTPGSVCEDCYKFWVHQKLEPKKMVSVLDANGAVVRTANKQLPVVVCPWCDGDLILSLDKEAKADDSPQSPE